MTAALSIWKADGTVLARRGIRGDFARRSTEAAGEKVRGKGE
jgi:hypothetical protein